MNIIQIGSNKGTNSQNQDSDDFYHVIKNFSISKLILVEPLSFHIESLKNKYSNFQNVIIENIAITANPNEKEIDFFYHKNDGPLYLVASTDKEHILRHGYPHDGIIKIKVPSVTICDLFDKYNILNIDILCIDAEGLDGEILKSINFDKFKIKEIYYEHTHQKFNIADFLKEKGYIINPSWRDTTHALLK